MNTTDVLNKLVTKKDLTQKEASVFLLSLMSGEVTPAQAAAMLTAMRMKGETSDEILGFIKVMREKMLTVSAPSGAIDVCGTGGDGSGTFNISTTVAIVVAAARVPVVKHGNRAASSKSGSADVLENLSVHIQLTPEQAENVLEKVGMVFVFAPLFHPSMKQVAMIRGELKIRTVFNFLGPFANPANVKRQLIGVPSLEIAQKMAEVGKRLRYKHLMIVTGEDGLDEVSINAKTHVFEVRGKKVKKYVIDPEEFGFTKVSKSALRGGDAAKNATIIHDIFSGKKGPKRDIVVLNSAFALYVAGRAKNIREGIAVALEAIDSEKAAKLLEKFIGETNKYA